MRGGGGLNANRSDQTSATTSSVQSEDNCSAARQMQPACQQVDHASNTKSAVHSNEDAVAVLLNGGQLLRFWRPERSSVSLPDILLAG